MIRLRVEWLYQIHAPHFCAGVVVRDGRVTAAAPIVRWAIGKNWRWCRDYFDGRNWSYQLC